MDSLQLGPPARSIKKQQTSTSKAPDSVSKRLSSYLRIKANQVQQQLMLQQQREQEEQQRIYDEEGEVCVDRLVRIRARSQSRLRLKSSSSVQRDSEAKSRGT